MKVISIGDTHGRSAWNLVQKIEKDKYDKFVFIGDYFDSFTISFEKQYENFEKILQFKSENRDKVVLLIGNHDFHYLRSAGNDQYSGYQGKYVFKIREILQNAIDLGLMQMAFEADGFLYTHAGVTKTWLSNNSNKLPADRIVACINNCFDISPEEFKFNGKDPYGDDVTQSPIWVRPDSLSLDTIGVYKQVVGHTSFDELKVLKNIHFIDCLAKSGQYLFITDGKPQNKTI